MTFITVTFNIRGVPSPCASTVLGDGKEHDMADQHIDRLDLLPRYHHGVHAPYCRAAVCGIGGGPEPLLYL
jgi:hypothetical protein